MWPLAVLSVLVLAVIGNGVFWRLDAPPVLVAGFDVALLLPLLLCALNVPPGWDGPTVDECLDRLRRAGWSVGETGTATRWVVSGSNGENVICAEGRAQAEAWWNACVQAREMGLLAPHRRAEGR